MHWAAIAASRGIGSFALFPDGTTCNGFYVSDALLHLSGAGGGGGGGLDASDADAELAPSFAELAPSFAELALSFAYSC